MGGSAVPCLVDALKFRKGWVLWEPAKALGQIPDLQLPGLWLMLLETRLLMCAGLRLKVWYLADVKG